MRQSRGGSLRRRWLTLARQVGCHGRQELASQLFEELSSDPWRVAARDECAFDDLQSTRRVTLRQRDEQLVQQRTVILHDAGCHHLVERRKCVTRRATPATNCGLHGRVGQIELSVSRYVREQQRQHVGIEQTELVVLRDRKSTRLNSS